MPRLEPPVVALVGIDGSGKSTVLSLIGDRVPTCVTLSSMRNHDVADAPLRDLSEALDRLRTRAHSLNSPRLVLATMFLQMCMFGPTERFFSGATSPTFVLADRHPVVDATVHLPTFKKIIDSDEAHNSTPDLRSVLGPKDAKLVVRWLEAQGRRLDEAWSIDDLCEYLLSLTSIPDSVLLENLTVMLQTPLPQLIIWLDIDIDIATDRLASRSGLREIHESRNHLTRIRTRYQHVLNTLPPEVQVFPIAVDERSPDQVADSVITAVTERQSHVLAGVSAE